MDKTVLAKHRKWTAAIYPRIVSDLAEGRVRYMLVSSCGDKLRFPSNVPFASGYFGVLKDCFGRRKNIACSSPDILNKYVLAIDDFLGRQNLSVRSRDGGLKVLNAYCKLLFSYEEFCAGNVLRRDEHRPNVLCWGPPAEATHSVNAMEFVKSLKITCCPYCNLNSLNIKKDFPRTEIDHFFPRAYYPCLGLSLYNLIPACTECNHKLKGKKIPDYGKQYSPYDKEDYHKNVIIRNAGSGTMASLLPQEVHLEADCRTKNSSLRPLEFRTLVDYLGRYEKEYREKFAEIWNLYPYRNSSYRKESIRRVAKSDKAAARRYFMFLRTPRQINNAPLSKVTIDAVSAREWSLDIR